MITEKFPVRINKYIAERGIATRKYADEMIKTGLVLINGQKAKLGDIVKKSDMVVVKRHEKSYEYYAYNKPIGIVTSTPQKGEISIEKYAKLPKGVFPIGRLDKDSEGLIILTNDGRITDRLLNPKYDHEKEYEVSVDKSLTDRFIKSMSSGVVIKLEQGAYKTKPAKVKRIDSNTFSIIIKEGKKRQIRRMCEALGYKVMKLKRIRILGIRLGNLKPNNLSKISSGDVQKLLGLLGL